MQPERSKSLLIVRWATLVLITVVAYWPPAWAQSRWYHIEVIMFRYTEPGTAGGEQWPELSSLPDLHGAQRLLVDLPSFEDEPTIADELRANSTKPIAFQSLPRAEQKLGGVDRALRNSSTYEVLLHDAWRQPALGGSRARAIYFSDRPAGSDLAGDMAEQPDLQFAPIRPHFEGTIRFRAARLLHIDTDFVLYRDEAPVRLTESRKVKLKEIHYFDHPLFGVLVQVTPYHPSAEIEAISEP